MGKKSRIKCIKIFWAVICTILLGAFGNSSYMIVQSAESEENDTQQTTDQYFYVGDTIQFKNGVSYTILGAGKYEDDLGEIYAYLEVDILNQSGEVFHVSSLDFSFYGDDYALSKGYPYGKDTDDLSSCSISNGRKQRGRVYADCPNYNNLTRIEAELGEALIVIKNKPISEISDMMSCMMEQPLPSFKNGIYKNDSSQITFTLSRPYYDYNESEDRKYIDVYVGIEGDELRYLYQGILSRDEKKIVTSWGILEYDETKEMISGDGLASLVYKSGENGSDRIERMHISSEYYLTKMSESDHIYSEAVNSVLSEVFVKGGNKEYLSYVFYDINKDGYLELLIQMGTCDADMRYDIYTTDGSNCIFLGEIPGAVALYENTEGTGFYTYYSRWDYDRVYFIDIGDNGKLTDFCVYEGVHIEHEQLISMIKTYSLGEGIIWPESNSNKIQEDNENLTGIRETDMNSAMEKESVLSIDEVGGFEEWRKSGFQQMVRTDLIVQLPVTPREANNYAVLIGEFALDIIVIMQEDMAPVKEWDWLIHAAPLVEGEDKAYFKATLAYTGRNTDDGYEYPIFIVSNVKEYGFSLIEEEADIAIKESINYTGGYIDGTDSDSNYIIMTQVGNSVSYQWYAGSEFICGENNLIVNEDGSVCGEKWSFFRWDDGILTVFSDKGECYKLCKVR